MEQLLLDEFQQNGRLSKKACDALRRKGIPDLSAIQYWTRNDLLRVDGIGEVTVKKIEEILGTHNLRLRNADAWDWRRTISPNKIEKIRNAVGGKIGVGAATTPYFYPKRSFLSRPIAALLIAIAGIPLGFVVGLVIVVLMYSWYFAGALVEGGGNMYAAQFWFKMWTEEADTWGVLSISTFLNWTLLQHYNCDWAFARRNRLAVE